MIKKIKNDKKNEIFLLALQRFGKRSRHFQASYQFEKIKFKINNKNIKIKNAKLKFFNL